MRINWREERMLSGPLYSIPVNAVVGDRTLAGVFVPVTCGLGRLDKGKGILFCGDIDEIHELRVYLPGGSLFLTPEVGAEDNFLTCYTKTEYGRVPYKPRSRSHWDDWKNPYNCSLVKDLTSRRALFAKGVYVKQVVTACIASGIIRLYPQFKPRGPFCRAGPRYIPLRGRWRRMEYGAGKIDGHGGIC